MHSTYKFHLESMREIKIKRTLMNYAMRLQTIVTELSYEYEINTRERRRLSSTVINFAYYYYDLLYRTVHSCTNLFAGGEVLRNN